MKDLKVVCFSTLPVDVRVKMIRGLISEANSQIFSAFFRKKNGSLREMVCRRHVLKGVKGTSRYDVEKVDRYNNQLTVFDMQNIGFRKINLDELLELRVDRVKYVFNNTEKIASTLADMDCDGTEQQPIDEESVDTENKEVNITYNIHLHGMNSSLKL